MSADNRARNATRNIKYGFVNKMLLLVAAFVAWTAFIRIMGAEYTGINSLYTNILKLLSLSDLGLESAMIYELYGPIREHDEETIRALVGLFRRAYYVIMVVILAIGLVLLPFLPYITNSSLEVQDLYLYYLLYLANSVCSYIAVHNRMVVTADQKYYIVYTIDVACKFVQYVLQTIYLVITHDFVGYLVIQMLLTVIYNLIVNVVAQRMYPYLQTPSPRVQLPEATVSRLRTNVIARFIEVFSQAVLSQTDSIIISVMFGVISVGYYENYNMLVSYITSVLLSTMVYAIEASIGDLNAEGSQERSYGAYQRLDLLMSFVNTLFVVEFVCVVQDFVSVWIGADYIQSYVLVAALMGTFYVQHSMNLVTIYRQTLGLFNQVKSYYVAMAILNIVLSVIMGYIMGVVGVVAATGISRFVTVFWREGDVVFRHLGISRVQYYIRQMRAALLTVLSLAVAFMFCSFLNSGVNVFVRLVLKSCIAVSVCMAMYYLCYRRSPEWDGLTMRIRRMIQGGQTDSDL